MSLRQCFLSLGDIPMRRKHALPQLLELCPRAIGTVPQLAQRFRWGCGLCRPLFLERVRKRLQCTLNMSLSLPVERLPISPARPQ